MLHAVAQPGGIALFARCKFALVFMLLALPCFDATQDSPVLGDGSGAYKTHEYRDLFAEQGHPPGETRAKTDKAFQQLFHGDGQEQRLYFETGSNENGPLAYITDWANNDARTEGMSYGMMIAVQMDKKREFDALWNWSNTYMLITDPNNPSVGYFAWSMSTDGSPRSTGAAPDGEELWGECGVRQPCCRFYKIIGV
jgi:oligosaccharide reducing-end xylanase